MNNEQITFIKACIEKHGHQKLWSADTPLKLTIESVSGVIPTLKNVKSTFIAQVDLELSPLDEKVIFSNLLETGDKAIYNKGSVKYINDSNEVVEESQNHRKTFSFFNKIRRWNLLDTIYFFGYSLTTYYSVPSILLDLKFIEELAWESNVQNYRGFRVEFPKGFDTHCKIQTFYFHSQKYLLYRHGRYVRPRPKHFAFLLQPLPR